VPYSPGGELGTIYDDDDDESYHSVLKHNKISQSLSTMWLVNLAGRDLLYGPLKFKAFNFLLLFLKCFVIYCQVFLTFIASKSLKPSFTLYCVLKRANDLTTPVSNWLVLLSTCVRSLKPLLRKNIPEPVDYTVEIKQTSYWPRLLSPYCKLRILCFFLSLYCPRVSRLDHKSKRITRSVTYITNFELG